MARNAPHIVWTHRAERPLEETPAQAEGPGADLGEHRDWIDARLADAFDADHLIVLDLYLGFRPRPCEHILLLDVCRPRDAGAFIVKLADDDARLLRECQAWDNCRGRTFSGDRVFMRLPGPVRLRAHGRR